MNMKNKANMNSSLIVIAIITLFIFIISFTVFYTEENFSAVCGCKLPIWVIIISITSFGMFMGSLVYYFLNKNILKEKTDIKNSVNKLLNLMDDDQKKVLNFIIKNSGQVYQSQISKELNNDKVKVSRILNNLEKKEIIERKKKGITNLIIIDKDIMSILKSK
ncbi:MAG: MarR family transcriptional regulator [Candidatus Nanoarchaeia archaeon]|nr:MarR family transcriptional regulator [Candidatus Nanoarchaeia archaeon]